MRHLLLAACICGALAACICGALAACICGALAAQGARAQTFSFTTIDNQGDPTFNRLLGINDSGGIVGYYGSGQAGHPNIAYETVPPYTKFKIQMVPGAAQTQETGINNSGLITGFWSDTNTGTDANFAFLRVPNNGQFTYVSTVNPLTASVPRLSRALGLNNSKMVVGVYADESGVPHGFTYSSAASTFTAITLPGNPPLTATAINDHTQTVGFFTNPSGETVSFERVPSGILSEFEVPGTRITQLFAVNNPGIAVGSYTDASNITHGLYFSWYTRVWLTVDDPNAAGSTILNGINDKGQMVGSYTDAQASPTACW
jgi:hypothetical protein